MKRLVATASAGLMLTLGGCIAPPEGVSPEDVADYKLAAASIGCEMATEADFQPVELQAGLTREQATGITAYLLSKGEAERLPGGGVKLTTGACS